MHLIHTDTDTDFSESEALSSLQISGQTKTAGDSGKCCQMNGTRNMENDYRFCSL